MKVGLLTIQFRLYAIESLKQKRSIVKRILAEVQRSGPSFAACELGDNDSLTTLTLRVAHLSNDVRFSDAALQKIGKRLERGEAFEQVESHLEIL